MSKDKYLSIFSPQMETTVLIILQIFFATRTVSKIGEYSLSWEIFGHVTYLTNQVLTGFKANCFRYHGCYWCYLHGSYITSIVSKLSR